MISFLRYLCIDRLEIIYAVTACRTQIVFWKLTSLINISAYLTSPCNDLFILGLRLRFGLYSVLVISIGQRSVLT